MAGEVAQTFIVAYFVRAAHHATAPVVGCHDAECLLGRHFGEYAFLVGTGDEWCGRASGHDVRIASGHGTARQQAAVAGILHEAGSEVVLHFRPGQPPKDVQVPLRKPKGIRTVHVEPCPSLVVFGQRAGMVFHVDRL